MTKSPPGPRFRRQKLGPRQLLPVYRQSDIPDLDEADSLKRAVPLVETGVDKEEEEEHHLQAAISAKQAAVTTGEGAPLYIPTPDASRHIENYDALYKNSFAMPSTLIRFSSTVEDCVGCPYCMDEEDEAWLVEHNKRAKKDACMTEDQFELVMSQLEKATNEKVPFLSMDVTQIPTLEDLESTFVGGQLNRLRVFARHIYPHWKERRTKRGGKQIMPQLRMEDTLRNEADPYLCFRRRETRPMRKTRGRDNQALDKLRRLRHEMETARSLLEMVSRREKYRKESLVIEHMIFEQKCKFKLYQRRLGIREEDDEFLRAKKKRKVSALSEVSSATLKIPLGKIRSGSAEPSPTSATPGMSASMAAAMAAARERALIEGELARYRERNALWEDVTQNPYQPLPIPYPLTYFKRLSAANSSVNYHHHHHHHHHGGQPAWKYRKRVGRGGRIFLDRRCGSPAVDIMDGAADLRADRYKFDNDLSEGEDTIVLDDMKRSAIRLRCKLLNDADLWNLMIRSTYHPSSTGSGGEGGHSGVRSSHLFTPTGQRKPGGQQIPVGAGTRGGATQSGIRRGIPPSKVGHSQQQQQSSSVAGVNGTGGVQRNWAVELALPLQQSVNSTSSSANGTNGVSNASPRIPSGMANGVPATKRQKTSATPQSSPHTMTPTTSAGSGNATSAVGNRVQLTSTGLALPSNALAASPLAAGRNLNGHVSAAAAVAMMNGLARAANGVGGVAHGKGVHGGTLQRQGW
ncbi:uncharacterized protein VTP21DRAFT_1600 [Calcarisporiella thermophila]|uniref:uncharacterized protein n=1 Tax=Calcarisporiella thermophila TaxID=911321 RepID=UPI0037430EE8